MAKILTYYALVILFVSCGGNEHWRQISSKGLDGHFNDMLFINDSTGWIAGSKLELSLKNQDAVIYKTRNGGRTWTPNLVGKGSIEHIFYMNDTLFGVKHVFDKDSFEEIVSVLLKSEDSGESWKEVAEIRGFTKQLFFVSTSIGYLVVDDADTKVKNWKLLRTLDGGQTWTLIKLVKNLQSVLFTAKSVFISQYNGNSVLTLDVENDTLLTEELPKDFKADFLVKDNMENVWVIGRDTSDFVLLKRESQKEYYRIDFDMLAEAKPHDFWTEINISDSTISIITGGSRSLLGVTHRFFISHNLGKNWAEEEIPFPLIVRPTCFNRGRIWIYGGEGLLQVRDPEIAW